MSRPFICEPRLVKRWREGDHRKADRVSDNACFAPAMDGRGLYCVTMAKKRSKTDQYCGIICDQILAVLIILCLGLSGEAWGQTASGGVKGGGPGNLYNAQSVVTVSGTVVSKTPASVKQGLPYLVYLTLQTTGGKITIFLGPSLYLDKLPVPIKVLDRIQVTGSKITWEGSPVILATEVKKGETIIKLRDPNGVPVWSGKGDK